MTGCCMLCSYFERAIRMAFSARAMRFVTISPGMRKLAGALFQTIVPILTVLGFCESQSSLVQVVPPTGASLLAECSGDDALHLEKLYCLLVVNDAENMVLCEHRCGGGHHVCGGRTALHGWPILLLQ
jgi:hypothetical protein